MNIFGLTLNSTDLWLLSIVGALVAILIRHRLSNAQANRVRRIAASDEFYSTVLEFFSGLYPLQSESDWPKDINTLDHLLRSFFPKMQIAVEKFKLVLPWHQRIFFNRDWSRFRNAYGREQDIQCYHHYMSFDSNPHYKENFKRNIKRLLKFAKKI